MNRKTIVTLFICFFLILNIYALGKSIPFNGNKNHLIDDAQLPTWAVGNFWRYDMNFDFIARENQLTKLSINATINNMEINVIDFTLYGGDSVYLLSVDGEITGDVFLLGEFNFAELDADLTGFAYIETSTLSIKNFEFDVLGQIDIPLVGWRDITFDMYMDFNPRFDFLDFPIEVDEEPWEVHIDSVWLNASVWIDLPLVDYEKDYSSSILFNDIIMINRTELITVPAGTFDCFVLNGIWGYLSNLWYSSIAGYLVKVEEGLIWGDGDIESVFELEMVDTNYDENNNPPETPQKPTGPIWGETEVAYTYSTKTIDPENDNLYYFFDWGDGTNSGWIGPYNSGEEINIDNMWFEKGVYNIIVKAKDEAGVESSWSQPLSVTISGTPKINIFMHKIEKMDELDYPTSQEPEWFYEISAISEENNESDSNHNTDDGSYNGNWISSDDWTIDKNHELIVTSPEVITTIKIMDHDDFWEGGADDLADSSGSNYPDCDGVDDGTPDKRGALFHGTYDMIENQLKPFDESPSEFADYVTIESGYLITKGDFPPDNSTDYEGGIIPDPENDVKVYFKLTDDYETPEVNANVIDLPENPRPGDPIQFVGGVFGGAPIYKWFWDFDDGTNSDMQNPVHIFYESGVYSIKLNLLDGLNQTSYDIFNLIIYDNHDPILTEPKVTWTGGGGVDSIFTFSVHYKDNDKDIPTIKKVIIDEKSYFMNGMGHDNYFNFDILGSDLGKGKHVFYFYFEDGYGGSDLTEEKEFRVGKAKVKNCIIQLKFFNIIQNLLIKYIKLIYNI